MLATVWPNEGVFPLWISYIMFRLHANNRNIKVLWLGEVPIKSNKATVQSSLHNTQLFREVWDEGAEAYFEERHFDK